jgi:NitT/TauT family transport system substrate-binding protein
MRIVRTALLCAVIGLIFGAAGGNAAGDTLPVIRIGILTSTTDAPLWIADRYGYNAVARGADVRLVADLGSDPPGYGFNQMIVRADLVKSGKYKSIKDAKGLTIATNALGSPSSTQLVKFLAKGGLTVDDVKHIYLPYTQHEVALKNGSLDIASTIEPFATDAIKSGVAVKAAGDDEFCVNQEISVIMYGGAFVRDHRDQGVRFMRAYIRGARFYNDALAGGKLAGPNSAAVIKLLNDETKMDPAVLRDIIPPGTNPDGKLNVASLRDDLAYFKSVGLIEGNVTADQTIDTSFAVEARKSLGPYRKKT